jgi:HAD superfamily hydrolase (TIGR01509 family)
MVASGAMGTTTRIRLPGPYAGVVLDMDGLLVETEQLWLLARQQMFGRYATTFEPADETAVFGRDDAYAAAYFAGRFGLGPEHHEPLRVEYLDRVGTLFGQGTPVRPGALELLRSLHGRVPVALASNTKRILVDVVLERTGIGRLLDAVATSDDAEPKPAPGIYLAACRRLGVDPARAVALEDSPAGVTAAKRAGMTCIAVPSEAHGDVSHADHVVRSLLDLL